MSALKRVGVGAVVAVGALGIAACGSTAAPRAAPSPSGTPTSIGTTRDLASYELFVAGTATGDPAETQLFGVRFDPLSMDRLSTDNRIRSFAADTNRVVVSFADGQTLKLAQLTSSGELTPIPGLGEPDALYPMLRDGELYYGDAQGKTAAERYRYYAWDLSGQRETILFSSAANEHPKPAGDGRFVVTEAAADGTDDLVVRDVDGEVRRYPLKVKTGAVRVGRDFAAVTTLQGRAVNALPTGLVLVNLTTGRTTRVPSVLVLCWNPDGTRLLTVRLVDALDDTQKSQLALVDPAHPHALPQPVATVPFPVYQGEWVRGVAPVASPSPSPSP